MIMISLFWRHKITDDVFHTLQTLIVDYLLEALVCSHMLMFDCTCILFVSNRDDYML